jgi:parallel beta-helix repeat protein
MKSETILVVGKGAQQKESSPKRPSIWYHLIIFGLAISAGFALNAFTKSTANSTMKTSQVGSIKADLGVKVKWTRPTTNVPVVNPKSKAAPKSAEEIGGGDVTKELKEEHQRRRQEKKSNTLSEGQKTVVRERKKNGAPKKVKPKSSFIIASQEYFAANPTLSFDYICNGTFDDAVINTAISNLAPASSTIPKRTISLTPGTFHMNGPIFITGDLIFKGAGRETTILRLIDAALPFEKAGFFRAFYVNNFEIRDLTADGNKQNQLPGDEYHYGRFGTYYEACNYTITDNIRMTNWAGYGFDPHGTGETTIFGTDMTVSNCISDNNDWDGYTIDKNLRAYVRNNAAYNNGRHGINIVTGTNDCEVSGNNVYDNGYYYYTGARGNGIVVQNNQEYGTHNVQIFSNTVTNNRGRGILLDDVKDITVRDNTISSVSACILVQNTNGTILARNQCADGKFIVIQGRNEGLMIEDQPFIQCSYALNLSQ